MEGIIISDSSDSVLGSFFKRCSDQLMADIDGYIENYQYLIEDKVNNVSLSIILDNSSDELGLFFAYCHGDIDMLLCQEGNMLLSSKCLQVNKLSGTIVYAFSCKTGVELGNKIIEIGGKSFIGYTGEALIQSEWEDEFMECINAGPIQLLAGNSSEIAYKAIIHKFKRLMQHVDFFVQSVINDNIDHLVLLGDPEATLY